MPEADECSSVLSSGIPMLGVGHATPPPSDGDKLMEPALGAWKPIPLPQPIGVVD